MCSCLYSCQEACNKSMSQKHFFWNKSNGWGTLEIDFLVHVWCLRPFHWCWWILMIFAIAFMIPIIFHCINSIHPINSHYIYIYICVCAHLAIIYIYILSLFPCYLRYIPYHHFWCVIRPSLWWTSWLELWSKWSARWPWPRGSPQQLIPIWRSTLQ